MSGTFSPFSIARLPRIEFGSGTLEKLPAIAAGYGRHLLLVTGLRSFAESEAGARLLAQLQQRGVSWEQVRVSGEPSPEFVDATVAALRATRFAAVVGVGSDEECRAEHDARRFLVDTLRRWEDELALPRLALYGIGEGDLPRIVAASRGSSMKTNPLVLSDAEITDVLRQRL